jgi:protein-S-isoprenylcysteine O-methyltransferase Ste14
MKRAMAKAGGSAAMGMDIAMLRNDAGQARAADAADLVARFVIIVLFTLMAIRIGADFLETGKVTNLLLLGSEALVVVLTVLRRGTSIIDRSHRARVLTAISMMGPVLVQPASVTALAPEVATVLVSATGFLVVIAGKLSLGRSFGLMPANRGVVSTGLYRLVRHPIYMGYLITHAGFLAANPTFLNLAMLFAADLALMWRAVCEEQTLSLDAAYREYQQTVRWRVVPGVF